MIQSLAKLYALSELETVKRDAVSSEGKSADERVAMFVDLMNAVDEIQSNLTSEERDRRRRISDRLDPRPTPWWRNFRKQELDEYQCQISST